MSLHDLLNTPLLRGKAAERWARPLIQRPMVALACATAVAAVAPLTGPLGAALTFGYFMWPRKQAQSNLARPVIKGLGPQEAWNARYDGAASEVRRFILKHKPATAGFDESVGPQDIAYVRSDSKTSIIGLNFGWFVARTQNPEQAQRWAKFAAGHEIGHAGFSDYWSRHALYTAGKVCKGVFRVGAFGSLAALGLMALGLPVVSALAAAALPTLMGSITTGLVAGAGVHLAHKIYDRQSEYRCDRHAVALTGDLQSMVEFAQEVAPVTLMRPSLLLNTLATHPCFANRVREAAYYLHQITPAVPAHRPRFVP